MENSTERMELRGAIQGLIDDSKTIDALCVLLETERINLVRVVTNLFDLDIQEGEEIATIDEIKQVLRAVDNAKLSIDDAKYNAEESYDNSDNCKYNCADAEDYISGISHIAEAWNSKIKAIEEANEEEDINENKLPKAPAKKTMNTYNQQ